MSYIDKSLGDGETVIARAHFHWLYSLCRLGPIAGAGRHLPGALLSWASKQPDFIDHGNPMTWLVALVALWFVLGLSHSCA